jgi:polygalacturonase
VTIRDLTIFRAGHFAILPTGVDDFTIDNVRIDTQRDGINLDACRNVRVSNVAINAPNDDALVLKSSYALGSARPTENVTITNSVFSGYDLGTTLDGTYGTTMVAAPDKDGPNGRIKLGTESNGGFRNITISNVTFVRSRGIALETVDGGPLEDVTITNVVMRDVTTSPIFIRLGRRGRGPGTPPVATVRRIRVAGLTATGVDPRFPILIAGIPGHPVEDVELRDIRVQYRGGGTAAEAAREPEEMESAYPEPSMFGVLPAYGLFARHVRGLRVRDVSLSFDAPEARPALALRDVEGASFDTVTAQQTAGVPTWSLRKVRAFEAFRSTAAPDRKEAAIEATSF